MCSDVPVHAIDGGFLMVQNDADHTVEPAVVETGRP